MYCLKTFFILSLCLASVSQFVLANESPKVIIIGAGAAGIAAATELIQKGIEDVTILEAEDWIGGRIRTVKLGDQLVDLGAQWVSGEKGNPVWDMASPLDLLEHSQDSYNTFQFFTSDGQSLDIAKYKDLTEHFRLMYIGTIDNPNNETFEEFGKKEFEKFYTQHPDLEHKQEMLHWIEQMIQSSELSESWNDFIPDNSEWGVGGDWAMNWKDKGYSMILDIMMKKYPDPSKELPIMDKIKMKKDVSKIDYTDENGKIKIHLKDGEIMDADDVIVTPSLGVLKATHETLFDPPLPDCKKDVIKNLGFGDATKIFLLFDKAWWTENPDTNGFSIVWSEKDIEERKDNPDKAWQLNFLGFFKPEHRTNILEMWISGKGAREVETMPEDKLVPQITELMQMIKQDKTVEPWIKMLRSKWHTDPHFRGAATYKNIDSWKNNVEISDMEKPIPKEKPRVWFAGEATDPMSYGSVNGAIVSGYREARKILEKYGKNNA